MHSSRPRPVQQQAFWLALLSTAWGSSSNSGRASQPAYHQPSGGVAQLKQAHLQHSSDVALQQHLAVEQQAATQRSANVLQQSSVAPTAVAHQPAVEQQQQVV